MARGVASVRNSWRRPPSLGGLAGLVLGAASLAYSLSLPLGSLNQPGPGFWPTLVSLLALISSAAVVLQGAHDGSKTKNEHGPLLRVAMSVASLCIFAFLFQTLGFTVSVFLLTFFWLSCIAQEAWRSTVIIAVATTVVLHLIFITALGVPFPVGVLALIP